MFNSDLAQEFQQYLTPSPCVNSDDGEIVELATRLVESSRSDIQAAVALYQYVRDEIPYNPYTADTSTESLRATATLKQGEGWCVSKAVLLAALCRAVGVPARLGFADVVNHMSTARLRETMKTDVFYFHGYCSIYLNGKWVKATPAFNLSLCEKFKLVPLDFNGRDDSLYHPFDLSGNKHMEYVNERGEYVDVPVDEMHAVFTEHYPQFNAVQEQEQGDSSWDEEVAAETSA